MAKQFDQLEKILDKYNLPWKEAFNLAQIPGMLAGQKQLIDSGKRAQAQVDAQLKAHYAKCGMPDAYQPPNLDEDEPVQINSPTVFVGIDKEENNGLNKPWWRKWLATLLAVLLGAAVMWFGSAYFNAPSDQFDMIAKPYVPPGG